ncbi:chemotaxis signal transduction protein (cheW domain) [Legionella busanensis]|uniref:Chemotaxis signal transduction protein (CheW domain) n=2 Tax=Legionella busanensis TaxID=190655 RepID=A0A378JFR1_9GAMM|nr:chemotaxis signal transduction protein (cheW domain) [Legionella busanensis]
MEGMFINCLKLRLNEDQILVDLNQIQMVLALPELDKLPTEDDAVAGLLNFHSQFIPVYHLASLVDEQKPIYDLNTPIVICSLISGLIGLLVSEAIEVCFISMDNIQKSALLSPYPYVAGILEGEKVSSWLLNLEELMHFHQLKLKNHESLSSKA